MAGIDQNQLYRDSAGFLFDRPDNGPLQALSDRVATKADASAIPQPADTMPMAERTGAAVGMIDSRYAKADHQHPRLTSTTYATLAADGTASVTFTRTFTNKPGLVMTETDASGSQPLVCVVQSWVRETMTPAPAGAYVGAVIKGYRSTILPTLSPLSPLAVLTAVVTGVNAINTALSNLNLFGGSASGASVSVIAVARSDVPAT